MHVKRKGLARVLDSYWLTSLPLSPLPVKRFARSSRFPVELCLPEQDPLFTAFPNKTSPFHVSRVRHSTAPRSTLAIAVNISHSLTCSSQLFREAPFSSETPEAERFFRTQTRQRGHSSPPWPKILRALKVTIPAIGQCWEYESRRRLSRGECTSRLPLASFPFVTKLLTLPP